MISIGFFGCGNLGKALAVSIKLSVPEVDFYFYTPTGSRSKQLADELGGHFVEKIHDMPITLDWYFLAFKPQNLPDFNFDFLPHSKLITILAGVSTIHLANIFNVDRIVRYMPNIASTIGAGANLVFINDIFSENEKKDLDKILKASGKVFYVAVEDNIDKLTPFSGSGPALIFELARIFEEELINLVGSCDQAKEIVTQTFFGAALMMVKQNMEFSELRNQVTSKNGVTFEALEVLRKSSQQSVYHNAFTAAFNRTKELSL